jgi:SAM-dependent methyltransferase
MAASEGFAILTRETRRLAGRLLDEDLARSVALRAYEARGHYREAWHQDLGLFDFEAAALTRFFPSSPARFLVAGCGGGRELVALVARGYTCAALEPVASLAKAARERLGPSVPIRTASLEDLGRDPPPPELEGPFDGVVVGWGAWPYLFTEDARVTALRELRRRCPQGPLLLSWSLEAVPGIRGFAKNAAEVRRQATAPPPPRPEVRVGRLVEVRLGRHDLEREARLAGSRLAAYGSYSDAGYPHAILLPAD